MREQLLKYLGCNLIVIGLPTGIFRGARECWTGCRVAKPALRSRSLRDRRLDGKLLNFPDEPFDHLWIDQQCFFSHIAQTNLEDGEKLAIGKVGYYTRSNGTQDLEIAPIPLTQQLDLCLAYFCLCDLIVFLSAKPETLSHTRVWADRNLILSRLKFFLDKYPHRTNTANYFIQLGLEVCDRCKNLEKRQKRQKLKKAKGFAVSVT